MPEPLKNNYDVKFVRQLASEVKKSFSNFDSIGFESRVFDDTWVDMELKQRMRHLAQSLKAFIPKTYRQSLKILKPVSKKFGGFESMFFPDYVELYGQKENDFETSMDALAHFTKYSSSEFAIRPFIVKYPSKAMKQMSLWSKSENHHLRRLASEGCRPRLPWAMALPEFKEDPSTVIKVISKLKNDESEYVRRSVANNLNDISKDSPEIVLEIAKKWLGKTKETDWLVKHACRGMLKAGDSNVLQIFGFSHPKHVHVEDLVLDLKVKKNDKLSFSFTVKSKKGKLNKLRLEYAIHFMKSNKKQAKKVFKISEGCYDESEKNISRYFSFKPISTRKYYLGEHALSIIINGVEMGKEKFSLI